MTKLSSIKTVTHMVIGAVYQDYNTKVHHWDPLTQNNSSPSVFIR